MAVNIPEEFLSSVHSKDAESISSPDGYTLIQCIDNINRRGIWPFSLFRRLRWTFRAINLIARLQSVQLENQLLINSITSNIAQAVSIVNKKVDRLSGGE